VISVPRRNIKKLLDVFSQENVEATVIGEFTSTKRLELFYHGILVCDLDMDFLHDGVPRVTKQAVWKQPVLTPIKVGRSKDLTKNLYQALSHLNVCSKENIIRRYDHEVQGSSVIKPLVGPSTEGPSDASVIRPKLDSDKGLAIANGINVRYGMIDPYWMAASCIDEAIRQITAVGGKLSHIAILDNFCWGNPDKPDRLGGLVRCAQGCYDVALGYQTPFISGKDSFYNEYAQKGKTLSIPGTLLISAIGLVDNVYRCVTMDFKKPGNLVYVIGETHDEMGGSIYLDTLGHLGRSVPKVNMKKGLKIFKALESAIQQGLVCSAHDCSEGGLAVALAEMVLASGLGLTAVLKKVPFSGRRINEVLLFSESNSRFVIEVEEEHQKSFEKLFSRLPCGLIGRVKQEKEMTVYGLDEKICIKSPVDLLKRSWQKTLRW
jgi:phosphoribosylformylglycinamidine (FGAM) synthase-like enzyme